MRQANSENMKSVINFESQVCKQEIVPAGLGPGNIMRIEKLELISNDLPRQDDSNAIELNLIHSQYISPLLLRRVE
ncbi:uncharacterized protein BDCG_16427 [Blastomyces dermatitidis ER-3]|uniref:Uncharacterized protein n=2 Tax=Ajellomyces dermatitidis TaxID=5039 RepID=A0A0J9HHA5_AJEDA|nr:uncharacterized protein BDCG_16427 [Blastomyces dermatitidis ER-3]EQL30058.1 hypothetical protein BDFG_07400 [Blastomyces dermatitidis ATCC 26199]KMW68529.1 hypothetical protein BDDG_12872 [Blastomyces dermatitidis ATCC 18188]OAT00019.1 hypothetical protein BDCG_16427 [Blastomyces dermatitidis ER-3]